MPPSRSRAPFLRFGINLSTQALQLTPSSTGPAWFKRLPFAEWGWRELNLYGWPLLATVIGMLLIGGLWKWLAIVPAALLVLLISFFRDPPRRVPTLADAIVSPADGTIVEVTRLDHYNYLDGPAVRIGIFLSIFNVHINRAPFAGTVVELHYQPGEFLNALRPESAERNESMWIGFAVSDFPQVRFAVRQISGAIARRIVCPLEQGQTVARGEKFGMIKLGSRTELILPADAVEILAWHGDKVRAGADVIARWK
jgi:phosphatidylserine decarboxylase